MTIMKAVYVAGVPAGAPVKLIATALNGNLLNGVVTFNTGTPSANSYSWNGSDRIEALMSAVGPSPFQNASAEFEGSYQSPVASGVDPTLNLQVLDANSNNAGYILYETPAGKKYPNSINLRLTSGAFNNLHYILDLVLL